MSRRKRRGCDDENDIADDHRDGDDTDEQEEKEIDR